MPTKVRLSQADGTMSTDRISGTVTLLKNQQMCILDTTAILDVSTFNVLQY